MLLAIKFHHIQPGARYPYPGIYLTDKEYRSVFFDGSVWLREVGFDG
jgi:hypothetical protein